MPNPIQAVIFDQDGLMFDTESLAATSWFEVGPKYGIHVDGNFLRGIRGCKPDKVKQVCTQQFGEEAMKDYDRFREEKRQYSYRWIAEHGVPVKKGLKELLIYLKDHNIKTAVATASSESWTRGNVRGAGVEEYFDDYIYGDMVKEAKPNPAIFLLAARRLGVEPDVFTWERLFETDGFKELDMLQTVRTRGGTEFTTTRCPITIDGEHYKSEKPAPRIGQDNRIYLEN